MIQHPSGTERSSLPASALGRELAALRIDRPAASGSWGVGVKLVVLVVVLGLLGGVATAAWQFRDRLKPPPLVKTDTVRVMTMGQASTVLTATGYLESRWQASVGANAPGRVEEINFEEGTKVQKGDLLAVLEHSQLSAELASRQVAVEQAQAVLAETENVLEQDQRDLARRGHCS